MSRARKTSLTILLLASALPVAPAHALSCRFSVDTLNFGTIDVLDGSTPTVGGAVSIRCRNGVPNGWVTICPNIGSGEGNPSAYDPRQMRKWGNFSLKLNFNLFDPATNAIWGSLRWPYPPQPPILHLQLDTNGRGTMSKPIEARVFAGQFGVRPGTYYTWFRNAHVLFEYKSGWHANCTPNDGTRKPRFRVRARVQRSCQVSATGIDFGSAGDLGSPITATGTLTVRCTNTTAHRIKLDGGLAGASRPDQRKMFKGTDTITYGIYKDAAHTQGWGSSAAADVNAVGTGYDQTYTMYGKVPAQPTPPTGTYQDTVAVRVYF